jgi:hypothetical protein
MLPTGFVTDQAEMLCGACSGAALDGRDAPENPPITGTAKLIPLSSQSFSIHV